MGTVRREGALADLQTEHGDRLAVTMLDLTDKAGIRAAVDERKVKGVSQQILTECVYFAVKMDGKAGTE